MKYWLELLICSTYFSQNFIESFGLENLEKSALRPDRFQRGLRRA